MVFYRALNAPECVVHSVGPVLGVQSIVKGLILLLPLPLLRPVRSLSSCLCLSASEKLGSGAACTGGRAAKVQCLPDGVLKLGLLLVVKIDGDLDCHSRFTTSRGIPRSQASRRLSRTAVAIEVVSSGAEAEPAPAQVFEVFAPDAGSFLAADSV